MQQAVGAVKLTSGHDMPLVGYGTFLSAPGEVGPALKAAINAGYRHIDCAAVYKNEAEIGVALAEIFQEGKVKREDLWITSKLPAGSMSPGGVDTSLTQTLKDLQLTYLDLYLVHLPIAIHTVDDKPVVVRNKGFGLQDVWRDMEKAADAGLAKSIGVSNYTVIALNDCLNYARIPPAVNQVELHPYFSQEKLVKFCNDNKVAITAYASLGAPGLQRENNVTLLSDPVIKAIADAHKKTAAQVLLKWAVQKNYIVIPKSVTPDRIKENFDLAGFTLTDAESTQIDGLNRNLRSFTQEWMGCPTFA